MADYLARVNPRYFAAIHLCAGDGDVRYWLNSVHIERHPEQGVILVATTGHVMAAIHDPEGWLHADHSTIVVGRTTKRLLSAIVRPGKGCILPPKLWIAETYLVLSTDDGTDHQPDPFGPHSLIAERSKLVEAKPLDWRRPIPKGPTTVMPWVNSRYIALFNDVAKILGNSKDYPAGGMRLEGTGDNTCIIVRLHNDEFKERFIGLVMPMRGGPLSSPVPAFVKAGQEAQL